MSLKIFSLLTAFVLSVFLFTSMASAVSLAEIDEESIIIPSNVSHDAGSFDIVFNLTNTGTAEGELDFVSSEITENAKITFNDDFIETDESGDVTETITATVTFDAHQSGTIEGIVSVLGQLMANPVSFQFSVEILPLSLLSITSETMAQDENTSEFTITNEGNVDLTNIELTVTDGFVVTIVDESNLDLLTNTFDLAAGVPQVVTVTRTTTLDDLDLGTNEITITAKADDDPATTASGTLTIEKVYCEEGEITSNIKLVEVRDNSQGMGMGTS